MDPHLHDDPERMALIRMTKEEAKEGRLVTRQGIATYFRTGIGTVGNWSTFPSFPRPVALLRRNTHPALLYRSGCVKRWVRKYRPKQLEQDKSKEQE